MIVRPKRITAFGLAASMVLATSAGCGSKPAEPDTAEVIPSKAPAEPAKPEVSAPEPAKDVPKG